MSAQVISELSQDAERLVRYMKQRNYICPIGEAWDKAWRILPPDENGDKAEIPLILGGWIHTNDVDKARVMRSHIEWADRVGVIKKYSFYLRSLPPEDWYRSSPAR